MNSVTKRIILLMLLVVFYSLDADASLEYCDRDTYRIEACKGNSASLVSPIPMYDSTCVNKCKSIWNSVKNKTTSQLVIDPPSALLDALRAVDDDEEISSPVSVFGTGNNSTDYDTFTKGGSTTYSYKMQPSTFVGNSATTYREQTHRFHPNIIQYFNGRITSFNHVYYDSNTKSNRTVVIDDIKDVLKYVIGAPADKIFLRVLETITKNKALSNLSASEVTKLNSLYQELKISSLSATNFPKELQCFSTCLSQTDNRNNSIRRVPQYSNLNETAINACYQECSVKSTCKDTSFCGGDDKQCYASIAGSGRGYCQDILTQKIATNLASFNCNTNNHCNKAKSSASGESGMVYSKDCSSYWYPKIRVRAKLGDLGCTIFNNKQTHDYIAEIDWKSGQKTSRYRSLHIDENLLYKFVHMAYLYKGGICVYDFDVSGSMYRHEAIDVKDIERYGGVRLREDGINAGVAIDRDELSVIGAGDPGVAFFDTNELPYSKSKLMNDTMIRIFGNYRICYQVPLAEGPRPCCLQVSSAKPYPKVYSLLQKDSSKLIGNAPSSWSSFVHPKIRVGFLPSEFGDTVAVENKHYIDLDYQYVDRSNGAFNIPPVKGCKTLQDPVGITRRFCADMKSSGNKDTDICVYEIRSGVGEVELGCTARSIKMPLSEIKFGVSAKSASSSLDYHIDGCSTCFTSEQSSGAKNSFASPKLRFFVQLVDGSNAFTHSYLMSSSVNRNSAKLLGWEFIAHSDIVRGTRSGVTTAYSALCVKGTRDAAGKEVMGKERKIYYLVPEQSSSANDADLCVRVPPKSCGYPNGVSANSSITLKANNITAAGSYMTRIAWPVIEINDDQNSATGYAIIYPDYKTNDASGNGKYHPINNKTNYALDPEGYKLYCPPGYKPPAGTAVNQWNGSGLLKINCEVDPATGLANYKLPDNVGVNQVTCVRRPSCPAINTVCSSSNCQSSTTVSAPNYNPYNIGVLDSTLLTVTDPTKYTAWKPLQSSLSKGGIERTNIAFDRCLDSRYRDATSISPSWGCDEFGIWANASAIHGSCQMVGCDANSMLSWNVRSKPDMSTTIGYKVGSNPVTATCRSGHSLIRSGNYVTGQYDANNQKVPPPLYYCVPTSSGATNWEFGNLNNSKGYVGQYNFYYEYRKCQANCPAIPNSNVTSGSPGETKTVVCRNGNSVKVQCGGVNLSTGGGINVDNTIPAGDLQRTHITEGQWSNDYPCRPICPVYDDGRIRLSMGNNGVISAVCLSNNQQVTIPFVIRCDYYGHWVEQIYGTQLYTFLSQADFSNLMHSVLVDCD